jgi:D-serine deaminase-like pyridoxal phosphate-dependent protein
MQQLTATVRDLRRAGHTIDVVTTGGTGTAEFCARHQDVTEVQPGSFMFMDADYLDTVGVRYQPALTAVATVISRPVPDRAVIDAGLKTLSNDSGPARLTDAPGWSYHDAGDEHGTLTPTAAPERRELGIGDRVTLLPSHIDTTVNLHDALHPHRNGHLEAIWAVTARGKVQ